MTSYNCGFIKTCSVMILLSISHIASALSPPPVIPEDEQEKMPGYTFLPSGVHFGNISVLFETTTLVQFSRALGQRSALSHEGDAGGSRYWLCYSAPATPPIPARRFWLISDGEMGGPEHAITEIIARNITDTVATADCPTLPKPYRHVSLDNYSLWLGANRQDVNRQVKSNGTKGPWIFSESYKEVPPGQCSEAWQGNWLSVQMINGRVDTIDAGQITSC